MEPTLVSAESALTSSDVDICACEMAEQLSAETPRGSVDRKDPEERLFNACEKGDLDEVKHLVSRGCDPNTIRGGGFERTPLHEACRY